jgi:hypothetical protein
MVVEGDATWLTFYNASTKKWTTLKPGERDGALAVKACNPADGSVVLELNGQTLMLALSSRPGGSAVRRSVALVDAAPSPPKPRRRPVMLPGPSSAEAHRLELVASAIRQRQEAAKRKRPRLGETGS